MVHDNPESAAGAASGTIWNDWTAIETSDQVASLPWPTPVRAMPRALVVTPDGHGRQWRTMLEACGVRTDRVSLSAATEGSPMAEAAGASLIVLDLRGAQCPLRPDEAGALIDHMRAVARAQRCPLLLTTDLDMLDLAYGMVGADETLLLCTPDINDILASIQAVLHRRQLTPMVHETRGERDDGGLEQLSAQLGRLSEMIETLVRDTAPDHGLAPERTGHLATPVSRYRAISVDSDRSRMTAERVRALVRARRLRDQLLPGDLFADPAWDMLLDLMAARLEGSRISVSSLCIASAVPPTTALRWIKQLTERGLLVRQADDEDGRRIFISLSGEGARAVEQWFRLSREMLRSAAG